MYNVAIWEANFEHLKKFIFSILSTIRILVVSVNTIIPQQIIFCYKVLHPEWQLKAVGKLGSCQTWMIKLLLKTVIYFHKKSMNGEAFSKTVIYFRKKYEWWSFFESSYQFLQKTWMIKLFWKQLSISAKNMNDEAFLNKVIYFRKNHEWWSFFECSYLFPQKTWIMKLFWKQLSIFL